MGRAPCCDKASVKKGPWSPEEDAKLKAYIEKSGTGGNWIALPQKIGLKRCGKSCRLRWLNYLRPNIKHGGFSEEEDHIICSLYLSIGSRWSIIASQLPGRTDNDIKNYWNTKLKKKLLGKQRKNQRSLSFCSIKQETKREISENILDMDQAINLFPHEFQQPHLGLPSMVPFQDQEPYYDVFYNEGTSTSLNATINHSSCPINGISGTSNYFDQCHNNFINSGFDGIYYKNRQQIWDGLDSFSGCLDMVNRSTITTASPESTSFEDMSTFSGSDPLVFNYGISQLAIPQDCTFQEYSRQLEMQQPHYLL